MSKRDDTSFIFRSENARQPADKIRAAHVKTCCVELCGCHMGLEQFLMEMNSLLWNALKNRRKLIDSKTVAKNNFFRLDSVRISQPHANQPFTTSLRTLLRKGRPYRLSKAIETSLCLCTGGTPTRAHSGIICRIHAIRDFTDVSHLSHPQMEIIDSGGCIWHLTGKVEDGNVSIEPIICNRASIRQRYALLAICLSSTPLFSLIIAGGINPCVHRSSW